MFIQDYDAVCTEAIKIVATLKGQVLHNEEGEGCNVIQLVYALKILIISRFWGWLDRDAKMWLQLSQPTNFQV